MDAREMMKDFMLDFPTRLAKFEQRAIETGLEINISLSEMHIINKIGPEGSQKMNSIARRLGVTQATLTVACDRLESKDLIERQRDPVDKRVVTVRLTPAGLVAYSFHEALLDELAQVCVSGLNEAQLELLSEKIGNIYEHIK